VCGRLPRHAAVRRLPDASAGGPEVVLERALRAASGGNRPASTQRADAAPFERSEKWRVPVPLCRWAARQQHDEGDADDDESSAHQKLKRPEARNVRGTDQPTGTPYVAPDASVLGAAAPVATP